MINIHTSDSSKLRDSATLRKGFLFADATFLLMAGGMAMLSELLGYFWNVGPQARTFHKSPYTVGGFEAHGLAVLIAILLYRAGAKDQKRWWHLYAALVHMLLGGANLLFWRTFVYFKAIALGIITTIAHVGFVIAQGSSLVLTRRDRHS
jgi:phosphoglycerol transferase MdoB-like AlkP superfamily enzyme